MQSFDWRSLQKYFTPQATNDLNTFLEQLPQTAGQMTLIAAGIAWSMAAGMGLFTAIKVQELTEMRAKLKETQALRPAVPRIREVPIEQSQLRRFVTGVEELYPNLVVKQQGSSIFIGSGQTSDFGAFREAIGHVQNGGEGWKVYMQKLCVGRECEREKLAALLKISKVSVDKPN